ncbi:OmpH family outer membrane protein [Alphaproteobacteria bacterium]|nr:OmpH family outer membrane protein [Alphaproteobacteria bacterium]
MSFKKKKNLSKIYTALFFVVIILGATYFIYQKKGAHSYPAASIRIGLLNGEKIWSQLPSIKNLKKELNAALAQHQKDFSLLEADLRKENQDILQLQQSVDSKDIKKNHELGKRQKEFSAKVITIQQEAEKKQKEITQLYERSMAFIQKKVHNSIDRIAHEKNLSLILYLNQVAHHEASLNITDAVFEDLRDMQHPALR